MLLFFIFRCPNLVLLPVFYAVYAIRFMYKLYKNKLVLLAALLQVSSVLMFNLGCIALPLPYHYLLLYHSYTCLGNMHKTPIIQSHPTYVC